MKILTYDGQPPTTLGNPDVKTLLALFEQQNKILLMALTQVVMIPKGTCVSDVTDVEGMGR